ncbi:MAG TPA: hypothetical protein VFU47_00970, partial [Armatimonadota bacterium]|nr:hypothetical protein [Armatimonadota bacterium]
MPTDIQSAPKRAPRRPRSKAAAAVESQTAPEPAPRAPEPPPVEPAAPPAHAPVVEVVAAAPASSEGHNQDRGREERHGRNGRRDRRNRNRGNDRRDRREGGDRFEGGREHQQFSSAVEPIEGVLELTSQGHGFIRRDPNWTPSRDDLFVPNGLV